MFILPPIVAFALTVALALALYALGIHLVRRWRWVPVRLGLLLIGLALAFPALVYSLYYLHWFEDGPWLLRIRWAPLAEYYAAGLGLLAGTVAGWLPESRLSRLLKHSSILPLVLLWLVVPFLKPLLTPITWLPMKDEWQEGVCIQSTGSTCGPASAATLLHAYGIDATEEELAKLSWTSMSSTENWYLGRALRRYGDVRYVLTRPNPEHPPCPAIAGTRLAGGIGHFIVILEERDGRLVVGDPMTGRQTIPLYDHRPYHFTGFFIVFTPDTR
ncbi:MAG: cysteine peptidase family C39 domain-containing protein [Armatimonadota bacterium]